MDRSTLPQLRQRMQQLLSRRNREWVWDDMEALAKSILRTAEGNSHPSTIEHLASATATVPSPATVTTSEHSSNKSEAHWFLWFAEKIVVGILIGGGRIMQGTSSFLWTTILVFGYFAVLLAEVTLEENFKSRYWLRPVSLLVVISLAVWFALGFVWASDPLVVRPSAYNGNYAEQQQLGTIKWFAAYTALRVAFENDTDNDYSNLDMVLEPDARIAAVDQFPKVEGSQVFNTLSGQNTITVPIIDKASGKITYHEEDDYNPKNVLAFSKAARVICNKLPRHTGVVIVLALASILPPFNAPAESPLWTMFTTGHVSESSFGPRPKTSMIHIIGGFDSIGGRPRKIDKPFTIQQR